VAARSIRAIATTITSRRVWLISKTSGDNFMRGQLNISESIDIATGPES
jgi:hypothetical protein